MRFLTGTVAAMTTPIPLAVSGAPANLPPAIYADPPADPLHPASNQPVEIPSHGSIMNGVLFRPSGPGPFPLVVLIHGLPGNEQNLDIAQTLRRAGWAVLTFHFRGAFGSEGAFSIDHAMEDADAVIDEVRSGGTAAAWNIDLSRIVMMGHSLGGLAAAHAAQHDPARLATVLLAPWDPSTLAGLLRPMSAAERDATAQARWGDVTHGRLTGITAAEIGAQIVDHGERWRLADNAAALAARPLLVITAALDLPSSRAADLKAALAQRHAPVTTLELESNHSFDDRRIALQTAILRWLAKLPGAPTL